MKSVRILDTTLRDGGRIIDNAIEDAMTANIVQGLVDVGADIIELGFLRSGYIYAGNSTYFTEAEQMKRFIPEDRKDSEMVAFCDYGKEFHMWDFSKLPVCDGSLFTGIRLGFRKRDMHNILDICHLIQDKGYRLYIQGVESLSYSDEEMLECLDIINSIHPHCFGIVDTYGAMYIEDVVRFFNLVHQHLNPDICIDFHSHNNFQLSFSFAQQIIKEAQGKRNIVIDGTLEGVGKGIGNLNTELIMDYLNIKCGAHYNLDALFDMIDSYIAPLKKQHTWAYQIPYYLAGQFSSHANNIIYLSETKGLGSKDIRHVLERMDAEQRKRYNYDLLDQVVQAYFDEKK
jgi:4-hydroxy 2-oxovalerate aldolase